MSRNKKGSVFYNLSKVVTDEGQSAIPIRLSDTNTEDILDKSSDYECAVVRFNIPSHTIPIMRIYPEGHVNYINYLFRVTIDDIDYYNDAWDSEVHIYNYTDLTRVINRMLYNPNFGIGGDNYEGLWNKLIVADPLIFNVGNAPEMVYAEPISSEDWFEMHFDESLDDNDVEIFMRDSLYLLFLYPTTIQTSYGKKWYKLTYEQFPVDPDLNKIRLKQTFDTRKNMDQLVALKLSTSRVPVRAELIQLNNSSERLLTDYECGGLFLGRGNYFKFFPEGPLRWNKLETGVPLRTIDLNIYWTSIFNDLNIFYAPVNSSTTVKLEFRKVK